MIESLMSHEKLRSIKGSIKQWYSNIKINDRNKRLEDLNDLKVIDKKIDDGSANENDRENRIKLLQDIDNLDNLEAHDLIQKAHIKWDIEGDENSKFFHGIINQKRRSQSIIEKFQAHDSQIIFSPLVHSTGLCSNDRDFLETHVTLKEVKIAVWDCGGNKAPGPAGFSFVFVKKYWDLFKKDIFKFVDLFLASGTMLQGANSSFFKLFSKVSNPIHIKDFRLISLIGIHYKIIAKILANWLSKVIDWFKKIKKKMLIFKVDFEKAFESVSWKYLDFVLLSLGFSSKWRSWIRACLHSSRASILINGSPTFEFSIKRDLRQGDPLSPFLFILVMEGLHYAMSNAVSSGLIRGIKIGSSDITLSHLFYADDVIITTDWNFGDLDNIIRVLHVFYLASGLKISIHKSNIFGIGVPNGDVVDMARRTGYVSGIFLFTYIGLPIGLFLLDPNKDCLIIDRISNDQWKWNWSREDIGVRNKAYLRELLMEISLVDIIVEEDSCVWDMAIDGIFSVGDTRRLIDAKISHFGSPDFLYNNLPLGGGDKEVVKEYFTNDGFQRWKKIYGDGDDVNKLQLDIRIGHAKIVKSIMRLNMSNLKVLEDRWCYNVYVVFVGVVVFCLSVGSLFSLSLDQGNLLHLHANDSNCASIVSLKLTSIENYRIWASAMKLALQIKHKMGFDVYLGHVFSNNAKSVWIELQEAYDRILGSIMFNLLQKINTFKQGGLPISEYYHKLNSLWREFDIFTKLPDCTCAARTELVDHGKLLKLMQFLMGLDDIYQHIRSSLLTWEILPEVKDAFVIISREKSHKGIPLTSVKTDKPQVSSFVSKQNDNNINRNN
ncbi:putative RNA-directed DNA polymerase, eukaryota, reverse transcriptase zinc-binding domain protein [Tanacetum coccineum]|uniref:RNA-directed DNA polymerase, eukaryota, reverse transcriptase zinc-binding domain protein n=1 Tax=Tanacetum coccineum TaxID=301880 RepID=A0ABQ4YJN6_9ASTR